jgi:hypothetical protein
MPLDEMERGAWPGDGSGGRLLGVPASSDENVGFMVPGLYRPSS